MPTITLESDANGAPHPDPKSYAKKFTGRYQHRHIEGGIGHNLPQEDPKAFVDAIIDSSRRGLPDDRAAEQTSKVVHTARTRTTGGREHGISRSSDGRLDVRLAMPGSVASGPTRTSVCRAWSACFETAIEFAARRGNSLCPPASRSTPKWT